MPLNQLYFDHQVSLMRADETSCLWARQDLELEASLIAGRIACMQRAVYAAAAPTWEALAVPASIADSRSFFAPAKTSVGEDRSVQIDVGVANWPEISRC